MSSSKDSSQELIKSYMEQFMGVENYDDLDPEEILNKTFEAFQHLVNNFQQLSQVTKTLENNNSPSKAGNPQRPGTSSGKDIDFKLMKNTMSSIVKVQAWWRQKMAIKRLENEVKQDREAFNQRRQNETPEESALKEFATQLNNKNLTPEAFFRFCDPDYKMVIQVTILKAQITKMGLQLSRGQTSRLIMILDEELDGVVKREDYYDALEAYNVSGEKHKNVDGSPYYPFENRALFKLIIELQKKDISHIEIFNACDIDDNMRVDISELRKFIEGLSSSFNQKEIFVLMNYFDIDKNGIVEKDEFLRRMKKGEQSYKQSIVVSKQAAERKMQTSQSSGQFQRNAFDQNRMSQQNLEVQEDNFFEEEDIGSGDQNMISNFYNSAKEKAKEAYSKVTEVIQEHIPTHSARYLSPEDQKRSQLIQKMEREGQSFDTFFQQLKSQSTNGKLSLGVLLKGLEVSYPTITGPDRNFLVKDCVEMGKVDYLLLEDLFTKFSKKLKPSVAQAFQVISTNINKRMGGEPEYSIKQFFKAQNISESDVLSDMEFSIMFSGKFSNLSQRDLDQAFNSLNLDMDGFVHVRDLIEVLVSYSSPQDNGATAVADLNTIIPGFESMSPRTRSQEVIEYLINELNKKGMAPLNVYKMADTRNQGSIQVQVIQTTFKKFLPSLKDDILEEAMNAFGAPGPRDMITRNDFEEVFTVQTTQKGGYIPNSQGLGQKKQNNETQKDQPVKLEESTVWIRKLDNAMLKEGISPQVAFKAADLNNNGVITVDELRETIKKLIPEETITLAELKKIMIAFDQNRNGLIEENEFIDLISKARNANVTMIESPQKNRSQIGTDYEQRRSQLPLKDGQSNKGRGQEQDEELLALQVDQLDQKVNLKKVLGEIIINEEGQLMINSIGRRLKQEASVKPSEYVQILKYFDQNNSGMVHCRDILKFCEKYCKSNSTSQTLEAKWIANVLEFQKKNRNTKQFFEGATKLKPAGRIMEVELITELQKLFGISMAQGRQIYKTVEDNSDDGNVTLNDFSSYIDQFRQIAVQDNSKQSLTSASKLNVDIIQSKFWTRISGMLPRRKEQFDMAIGKASQQTNSLDYASFYEIMYEQFELVTIAESKSLFENLRQKGSLKNAIAIDVLHQELQSYLEKLKQAQFTAIGQVAMSLGTKFQEATARLKMNEHGFISKIDLKNQLTTLGIISKRGENSQDSKYAQILKQQLSLANEFEIPAQIQSCETFDQEFMSQMENCQFWAVIKFLSQLTNQCHDELIFKFLGKTCDIIVPNKQSSTLTQQAAPNTSVIANASELTQLIRKLYEYSSKKNKAFSHGEIDQHSEKMLLQLWPILSGKPIKLSNQDDVLFYQKINRHRTNVPKQANQNINSNNVDDEEEGINNKQGKSVAKANLLQSSINQREPIPMEYAALNELEEQMGIELEEVVDDYLLEDVVPLLQFVKKLSDVSTKVNKVLIRQVFKEIDKNNTGKLIVKDLILYLKNNIQKYDKSQTLERIALDIDEPIKDTLRTHLFLENDIMSLPDFYQQLSELSTVKKFQVCCLYFDLIDNDEDYFSIQVNNFITEVINAKKNNKGAKANIQKETKTQSANKKIDYEQFEVQVEQQEEDVEEVKKPVVKKQLGQKDAVVSQARTKNEINEREMERVEKSKEVCGTFIDMWPVINKDKENILKNALQKLNKLLSKSSLTEATKLIDPKNEGQITIYKLFKQLDQIANIVIEEKLVLTFLPLNYCKEGSLKVNSREYAKLARQITATTLMKPYSIGLKKVYEDIKEEVEDMRAGRIHLTSDNEEEDRATNVKTILGSVLTQLKKAMDKPDVNQLLENHLLDNQGYLDFYDFGVFIQETLLIKCTTEQLNYLCDQIDVANENSITAQALNEFFEEFGVNFFVDTDKFVASAVQENFEEGEELSCEDLIYKIIPQRDYFRENCSTILNSEEAALVMAEKLYKAIPANQKWFVDQDFGPKDEKDEMGNKMSLYMTGVPPTNYVRPQDIKWIGPEEICQNKVPKFLDNGSQSGDVQQGNIGDCWFISAMSVIATRDELLRGGMQNQEIKKGMKIDKATADDLCSGIFPPIFHIYRKKGLYVFRFFKDFKWRYVIIDRRIPCFRSNSEPVFGRCINLWETWVPLIEKGYAKLNGCYESLISGFIDDALNEMTGLVSEKIKVTDPKTGLIHPSLGDKDTFWQTLLERKKEYCMMGCSIVGGTEEKFKINGRPCGIITGHAYAILDVFEIPDPQMPNPRKTHRIVLVRNPWGNTEWNGKWSDVSQEVIEHRVALVKYIKTLPPEDRFDIGLDDGTFMMNYQSWRDVFNNMFICLDFPKEWTSLRLKSEWSPQYSGGLPTPANPANKAKWATQNPQFYIAPSVDIELFISIAQPDGRAVRGGKYYKFPYSEVINPVQFTVCVLKDPNQKRIQTFDASNQIFRSVIKEHREVSARVKLPKGRYVIVCSTRNQGELGPFYLSLYFNQPASLVKLTDLQDKSNKFFPILEEQENLSLVQPWKKNLCKKRLDFMLNKEDEEVGDYPEESMEQSFLGSTQEQMKKAANTSNVKTNQPAAAAANNKQAANTSTTKANNQTSAANSKANSQSTNVASKQPIVSKTNAVVNKNTQPVTKNTQPVSKQQPPAKKVVFSATEDFE